MMHTRRVTPTPRSLPMGKLKIVVLYDRVLVDEDAEQAASTDKSPVTRTLDKKEVEDEVAEALVKLGHEAIKHELDGTPKSLLALARIECDLVFNLTESFAGDDTADFKIAGFLELIGKRYTGSGTHGLMLAQDKAIAKKIFAFHGVHTPVFAKSFRGRLDFSHDLQFPVIVKPAREDGSIGIEFSAVVSSIRELMERMDWLHANFDSPVLIEEYIEGREMYVGVIGNDKPEALPVVELDLSKLPGRHAADCRGGGEVGQGHEGVPGHQVGGRHRPAGGNHAGAPADGGGRLSGARAAGLRPRGHAAAARRPGPRHRGQPQPLAQLKGRVCDGRPEGRTHLPPARRGDCRAGHGPRLSCRWGDSVAPPKRLGNLTSSETFKS